MHGREQRPERTLTKATARLVGTKTKKAASGKGKAKVRLKGKVKKTSKVEVTFAQASHKGKIVVPIGKAVKVSARSSNPSRPPRVTGAAGGHNGADRRREAGGAAG